MDEALPPAWLPVAIDAALVALCVAATITDLKSRRIYDWITFPAIGAGLALSAVVGASVGAGAAGGFFNGLLGALIGGLFFGLPALFGAVGMGDAKLMAGIGALLGFPAVIGALLVGTLAGGLHGVATVLARTGPGRRLCARLGLPGTDAPDFGTTVPYGPALALGALAFRLWQRLG